MTVNEWRRKHPKCKWCKHCEFVYPFQQAYVSCPDYYDCNAKDKIVHPNIPRIFCQLFELKEDK